MKTLLRLGLATLLTFALTEAGLRLYRHALGQPPPHPDPSVASEWEWARDHLAAGKATTGSRVRHDPELGWTFFPDTRKAMGARGRVRNPRTPGVPRVVLVGDSFMRELGKFDEPFAEGRLFQPGWEVVNLGVQGYGVGQAWLRHRTRGLGYHADVAVFGLYLRDYFRTFRSFRGYAKPTFALGPGGAIVVGNVPVITPEALYEAYRTGERRIGRPGRSWVLDFIAERRGLYESRDGLREDQLAVFAALLRSFRDDAVANGSCPLLLIFPTSADHYAGTVYEEIDRVARADARALGLPYVALAEALYTGATPEARMRIFAGGVEGHMSPYGRHEVYRVLDEAFEAYRVDEARPGGARPADCFETEPDGSVAPG